MPERRRRPTHEPRQRRLPSRPQPGPRVADLLAALRSAFEEQGWHGPTVLESLEGMTAVAAAQKPPGAHHSIHELVEHIEYWAAVGLHHGSRGLVDRPQAADWAPPGSEFDISLLRLKGTHGALLETVSRLSEEDLERKVKTDEGVTMTLARVLHGVAAHHAYHAGQIRLLRVLLAERLPPPRT